MADNSSTHVSLIGGLKKRGRWRAEARMLHVAAVGGVNLDLTDAELDPKGTELTSITLVGGASLVVPDAMRVEVSGFSLIGGTGGGAAGLPDGPVLRLRVYSLVGGVSIRRGPAAG